RRSQGGRALDIAEHGRGAEASDPPRGPLRMSGHHGDLGTLLPEAPDDRGADDTAASRDQDHDSPPFVPAGHKATSGAGVPALEDSRSGVRNVTAASWAV